MDIQFVYQKKRREFGRQPLFRERAPEVYLDIKPDPELLSQFVPAKAFNVAVSCERDMSEHDVNTESRETVSTGMLHKEGGWPKDVDINEVEHMLRYRKKVEKDEEYIKKIKALSEPMEHYIKLNNALDIYKDPTPKQQKQEATAQQPSARTLNVLRDPYKRSATCLSWHPDSGQKIAVAYSILDFQQMPEDMSCEAFVWDIENPNQPDQKLLAPSPLVCLKFNPKDPHTLIGGCFNGLVGFWDMRKGSYPVDTSLIEKSHRDPVFSLAWIQSKSGAEFFSTSTDGSVFWWDTRKLSEPTDSMLIDPEKNGSTVGGTCLDYEPTMPTKFMVGLENGAAVLCNKKAKSANDRITYAYQGHHGPLSGLQRNPFYPKNFMTIGDWSVKIWSEDIRAPLISTKHHESYLTDGSWSSTRPAVFAVAKMDGSIDVWDLLAKQTMPSLSIQVSDSPVLSLKFQDKGKLLACGMRDGSVCVLELSDNLCKMQPNEKQSFSQMLERETKREKMLEGVAREKRLKAQAKKPEGEKEPQINVIDVMKKAEEDFFKLIKAEAKQAQ